MQAQIFEPVKYTPGPGLNSVILVVVSEVHVGTNLNSAVTEVPTKRRRGGTVWHHRGGAHGTTAHSMPDPPKI